MQIIEHAIQFKSDLIIFPELSITGHEPSLAKKLAVNLENSISNPFQELPDKNEIVIGIGMPRNAIDGINISMLFFQPNKNRIVYSKQILHADELPCFSCGRNQPLLEIKGKKIAIGICYEALQWEHFIRARENGAEIYIASVAKPDREIDKAFIHFPEIAKEFKTPILMSNCIGYCDNFLSSGQRSVWNKNGELISHLDNENQSVLIYDTELEIITLPTTRYKM